MFEQYVSKIVRGKGREDERAELVALLSDSAGSLMDGGMDEAAAQAEAIRRFEADADFQRLYLVRPWLTESWMTVLLCICVVLHVASFFMGVIAESIEKSNYDTAMTSYYEFFSEMASTFEVFDMDALTEAQKQQLITAAQPFMEQFDIQYIAIYQMESPRGLQDGEQQEVVDAHFAATEVTDAALLIGDAPNGEKPEVPMSQCWFDNGTTLWYYDVYFYNATFNRIPPIKHLADGSTIEYASRVEPWSPWSDYLYSDASLPYLYLNWAFLIIGNILFALWGNTKLKRRGHPSLGWTIAFLVFDYAGYWTYLIVYRLRRDKHAQTAD
ncbi:hypothetical protein LJC55_00835 [Eubacteriales bacterium OttesenSCG-928-N14]|nr:hypothetical protein [Eubacteriales bacterium OttesenSCG-928-N14]